jgi:hypothetical protein
VLCARFVLEYADSGAEAEANEMGFSLKKSSTGATSFARCTLNDYLGAINVKIYWNK